MGCCPGYPRQGYHRRNRGPSCAPMSAQSVIPALYQTAMNAIESLRQLNAKAAAPIAPARIPAIAPQRARRVGAPLRSAHIKIVIGIVANNRVNSKQVEAPRYRAT